MEHAFKFSVSHAADGKFDGGLRAFFEYRDLGIKEAMAGLGCEHPTDAGSDPLRSSVCGAAFRGSGSSFA
jgi:hypothetical protein